MEISKIKIGGKAPEEINVVVEIPRGSAIKYEIDEQTGELEVDRLLGSAMAYPFDYGFIPQTLAGDGDPLDAMIISSQPAEAKAVIACRPIGLLKMADEQGVDAKILCVPIGETDLAYSRIKDLDDLDLPTKEKIKLFFAQYKEKEKSKWTKVQDFGDKQEAEEAIQKVIAAVQ